MDEDVAIKDVRSEYVCRVRMSFYSPDVLEWGSYVGVLGGDEELPRCE